MSQNVRYQLLEPAGVHSCDSSSGTFIGEGAYGVVYKALDKQTGKIVALKKIRAETEFDGISPATVREITLLTHLVHENVVKLENVILDRDRMSLIFELLDMDLKKYLDQLSGELSPALIKSYASQMLSGLAHCHSMGVMHRDLKPHNILINRDGILKIADFGLARAFTPFQRPLTTEVITRWYRAPEVLLGFTTYTCSVDLWSVGCIIAELATKRPLMMGDSDIDQLYKIFRLFGTPDDKDWEKITSLPFYRHDFPQWTALMLERFVPNLCADGIDLLQKMFVYDPKVRISARQALKHSYLQVQSEPQTPKTDKAGPTTQIHQVTPEVMHHLPTEHSSSSQSDKKKINESDIFEPNSKRRKVAATKKGTK